MQATGPGGQSDRIFHKRTILESLVFAAYMLELNALFALQSVVDELWIDSRGQMKMRLADGWIAPLEYLPQKLG